MLPSRIRYWLFDTLSVQTMRYVSAVPTRKAKGLTKEVYDMIREDFFKNGSLTSRSRVPELMAAIWTGGRETMLVADKVDRTTKDAISAVLSQINDCPYCEDMLISLVHAGGDHEAANDIFVQNDFDASDETLRRRLEWVRAVATPGNDQIPDTPFTEEQIPEVIGTLMGMSDINRFSHVVMEDSPVAAPFGMQSVKAWALKMFGSELKVTRQVPLVPGRALGLLPPAELPADMQWAKSNPRVADAVSRWAAAVEREGAKVISSKASKVVADSLHRWNGEQMPIDSRWIDRDVEGLNGEDQAIVRLAIVLAKASYRVTEKMVVDVLGADRDQERFIRILAWSSFAGARRFAEIVAHKVAETSSPQSQAAA
ncbi:MAG: carboxymuconolactone decarboxylase family protein [Gammaproteobacteria bacterium]|nr:carboxymuconolactone decarboxylase family protein [Gammaproteobacteria bacterium]